MYEVVNILDEEYLSEMLWMYKNNLLADKPAGVVGGPEGTMVDYKTRSCKNIQAHPRMYPELTEALESYVNDGSFVKQFDFLSYEVGDHFVRHSDNIGNIPDRIWTTITLLERSDDLEGGELNIYLNGDDKETIKFDIGQTVIFRSNIEHEVLPIKNGHRKVLVAWLVSY